MIRTDLDPEFVPYASKTAAHVMPLQSQLQLPPSPRTAPARHPPLPCSRYGSGRGRHTNGKFGGHNFPLPLKFRNGEHSYTAPEKKGEHHANSNTFGGIRPHRNMSRGKN
jgi:hypothetical protein